MKRTLCAVGLGALCLAWVAPARAQVPDHLKCYKVKDPQAKTTYPATLGGLVAEPGCTIKVPATMACVPATKTNVTPPRPDGGGTGTPNSFFCYKVKCPKAVLPTLAGADQFGNRTVTPSAAKLLCAPLAGPPTTTTTTSTTTTTTAGPPVCCSVTGVVCGWAANAFGCTQAGGTVGAPGSVCDSASGNCTAPPANFGPCCQIPTPPSGDTCQAGPSVTNTNCASAGGSVTMGVCTPTAAGCQPRWADNGDGTVTDHQTGLQWEKKVAGSSCLHCVNDTYTWSSSGTAPDGTAFTSFLNTLNGGATGVGNCVSADGSTITGGFNSHSDWRLPTIAELRTILLAPYPCGTSPCIDPVFGPTATSGYWSSTTTAASPAVAWYVFFPNGGVTGGIKTNYFFVRAVRGGS